MKKTNNIYHISDIHIRLFQRQKEAKKVFENLYKFLREDKDENSILVCTGDIVHNKTEISPELISTVYELFSTLSSILPVVVIAGNHDTEVNNHNRLDSLSPILDTINNENLVYYKETGIYDYNENIMFAVTSVNDYKMIDCSNIEKNNKKLIYLLHDNVVGGTNEFGFELSSDVKIDDFKNCDYVMLGHIHKYQWLSDNIAYAGSLIQTNFGEGILHHGLIKWDLVNNNHEFVEIYNSKKYLTVDLINGKPTDESIFDSLTPDDEINLKIKNQGTRDEANQFIKEFRKQYKITYLIVISTKDIQKFKNNFLDNVNSITSIKSQQKLIMNYLKSNGVTVTDDLLQELYEINDKANANLSLTEEFSMDNDWKLLDLEFDNMFGYGENNKIDFTTLSGINGIFAPNYSGKSFLLEIILFMLYDIAERTSDSTKILNVHKNSFKGKLRIQVNGVVYVIYKSGKIKLDKNGNRKSLPVEVELHQEIDGVTTLVDKSTRRVVVKQIRNLLHKYETIKMANITFQKDSFGIVSKKSTERLKFLTDLFNLNLFEELKSYAKLKLKEYAGFLKHTDYDNMLNNQDILNEQISNVEDKLSNIKPIIEKLSKEILEYDEQIETVNIDMVTNKPDDEVKNIHIDYIKSDLELNRSKYTELHMSLDEINDKIEKLDLEELITLQQTLENSGIKEKYEEYKDINNKINILKSDVLEYESNTKLLNSKNDNILLKISANETEIKNLKDIFEVEYDVNCKYCMSNPLVIKSINNKENKTKDVETQIKKLKVNFDDNTIKMNEYKNKIIELNQQLNDLELLLKDEQEVIKQYNTQQKQLKDIETLFHSIYKMKESKIELDKDINTISDSIKDAESKIQLYTKNVEKIIKYSELSLKLKTLKEHRNTIEIEKKNKINEMQQLEIDKAVFEVKLSKLSEDISKYLDISKKSEVMSLYSGMMGFKNGIPTQLLNELIPVIEFKVNEILERITVFKVSLDFDDKNRLEINLNYVNEDKTMNVEMSSGFETTITALAFKVGFIELSSLPKFMIIDEGFHAFDKTQFNSLPFVFELLREKMEYILMVTHITDIKQLVDQQYGITKTDGISKVYITG